MDPYLYGGKTDNDRVQYQNKLPHIDKWGIFEKTTDTFFLFRLNSTDTERGLCQCIYRQSSRSGHVFRNLEINLFKEKFKSVCHQLYCNFLQSTCALYTCIIALNVTVKNATIDAGLAFVTKIIVSNCTAKYLTQFMDLVLKHLVYLKNVAL